jgi:hypoxia up-regulated 1
MFGIDRLDTEKPFTVIFYNMGGSDTEVSLVRYSAITDSSSNKSYEHIEIIAEASLQDFGGQNLDLILVNTLATEFNNLKERQGKPDVRTNAKAMKRLLKEVSKAKDILSANKNYNLKVSELVDYVSLNLNIERKDFQDSAAPFFERVIEPVEEVLKKAGMTIDEVDAIELLGGGIRVPRIQEILQEKLKKQELGVHLNGDEAVCFGSAFIAANSSASYKVRKVYLTQHPSYQIAIEVSPADEAKRQA